jgi:nicotinamide mononucleotide transporter
MDVHHWLQVFITQAQSTSWLEWVAIMFAVAEVLLARYNNVWLYPAGIISTIIYTWLFIQPSVKLYADAILNVYYFVMSLYGWVLWARRNSRNEHISITYSDRGNWLVTIITSLAGWAFFYVLLVRIFPAMLPHYTPSDMAVWDALITSTALAGMYLLAKRKIENWLVLNISNLIAIPIYIYKGMPFTACLTVFLFIVAIFGFLEWRKIYRATHTS